MKHILLIGTGGTIASEMTAHGLTPAVGAGNYNGTYRPMRNS